MLNQRGNLSAFLLLGALILITTGVVIYFKILGFNIQKNSFNENSPVICKQDFKRCPDGSLVGRDSANCQFIACPSKTSVIPIPSLPSNIPNNSPNAFSIDNLKVNDAILGMTVKSIKPYSSTTSSAPSRRDMSVYFTGKATLSGQYNINDQNDLHNALHWNLIFFEPDASSSAKLPQESLIGQRELAFDIKKYYSQFIQYGQTGKLTIVIDNFTYNYWSESDTFATADLIQIIPDNK